MQVEAGWTPMDEDGFFGLVGIVHHLPVSATIGRFRFETCERHRNRNGTVHGGVYMALADRCLGVTARQTDPERRHATMQLDVHFVRAAPAGATIDLECRLIRETSSVAFVEGDLTVGGEIVATARGVWKIIARGL